MSSAAMILLSSHRRTFLAGAVGTGSRSTCITTLPYNPHRGASLLSLRLQQQQQSVLRVDGGPRRSYLYLPVSWQEFRERFQRWIEAATEQQKRRVIKVQLLRRNGIKLHDASTTSASSTTTSSFPGKSQTQWNTWVQQQNAQQQVSVLPLPETKSIMKTKYQGWKSRRKLEYRGWKARRKEQYQGWKIKQSQKYQGWKARRLINYEQYKGWKVKQSQKYQGWKARRLLSYEGWKSRRKIEYQGWKDLQLARTTRGIFMKTKQIPIHEYTKPEWFDSLGRPLTSRDSTGRFVNPWKSQSTNGVHYPTTILKWRLQRMARNLQTWGFWGSLIPKLSWNTAMPPLPKPSPPLPAPLENKLQLTWIGHATCFVQMNGFSILTDPCFSLRAAPYQWFPIGVPRELPPAHSISEILQHSNKKLDICCITHDHYDHMDHDSVLELVDHVQVWVVPLGLADWLVEKCNVDRNQIIELEWWQQLHLEKDHQGKILGKAKRPESMSSLTITCCPASHWASRTMMDRNTRLWCSFALEGGQQQKLFICGDTGYPQHFPLFRQIGDALGPFDLAALPIGAYEPSEMMKDAHVHPQEALQIHKDIKSQQSVAIHWGSFPLSEEELLDPPKELRMALSREESATAPFEVLEHGGTIEIAAAATTDNLRAESETYDQNHNKNHQEADDIDGDYYVASSSTI